MNVGRVLFDILSGLHPSEFCVTEIRVEFPEPPDVRMCRYLLFLYQADVIPRGSGVRSPQVVACPATVIHA